MTTTVPAPKPAPRHIQSPAVERLVAWVGDLDEPTARKVHEACLRRSGRAMERVYRTKAREITRLGLGVAATRLMGRVDDAVEAASGVGPRQLWDDPWILVADCADEAMQALLLGDALSTEARNALLAPVVAAGFEIDPENTDATEEAQR